MYLFIFVYRGREDIFQVTNKPANDFKCNSWLINDNEILSLSHVYYLNINDMWHSLLSLIFQSNINQRQLDCETEDLHIKEANRKYWYEIKVWTALLSSLMSHWHQPVCLSACPSLCLSASLSLCWYLLPRGHAHTVLYLEPTQWPLTVVWIGFLGVSCIKGIVVFFWSVVVWGTGPQSVCYLQPMAVGRQLDGSSAMCCCGQSQQQHGF